VHFFPVNSDCEIAKVKKALQQANKNLFGAGLSSASSSIPKGRSHSWDQSTCLPGQNDKDF
jgi:hypothetical protein